jgi:general secretion pathway protein I
MLKVHIVTRRRKIAASPHNGLTLFELLLALAIFLTSLAALAQLLASGSRAAAQSQLQTEAILRCESKLGELVSGIEAIKAVSNQPFDDDPSWSWRVTVTDGPWPSLQLVELQVSHAGQSSLGNSSYTLRRYVRDARLFVDEAPRRSMASPVQPRDSQSSRPATRPALGLPGGEESKDSDE